MARGRWNSRTTFILAAVGSAVGLGNLWRFPYLTYEYGGGAFLIPYLIALFIIGIPLLMAEFALGQKFQRAAPQTFAKVNARWGGLGAFMLFSAFTIITYYAVVMAWALLYFIKSFNLPWAAGSESYFYGSVLQISESIASIGNIVWPILIALVAVWAMIYFSIWKGVKSVGKVVWWTVPLPILLLVVLFIRGVTLPGFLEGWSYYITPTWSALLDLNVWAAATSQVFFTMSLSFGVLLAYASYNKTNQDVRKDSWITGIADSIISIFAGFVVFAVLGYMATTQGVAVSDVVASGPGLVFVVFPEALSLLPAAGLFAFLFFATLLMLGIDSAFSITEAITSAIKDTKTKLSQEKIAFIVCAAGFLVGILYTTQAGLYLLDVVDHFVNFNLIVAGLLQAIVVGWVWGADNVRKYVEKVSDKKLSRLWKFQIKWFIPAALFALVVRQLWTELTVPYGGYPAWALAIGWAIVVIPVLIIIAMAVRKSKSVQKA